MIILMIFSNQFDDKKRIKKGSGSLIKKGCRPTIEYVVSTCPQVMVEWSYPNPYQDFPEGMITIILKQSWLYSMKMKPHWIEEICDTPAE